MTIYNQLKQVRDYGLIQATLNSMARDGFALVAVVHRTPENVWDLFFSAGITVEGTPK